MVYTWKVWQNLTPSPKLQRQLCTWAWGVKCSKEFGFGERTFCELRNWLVNRTDGLPQDAEVFNMNLYMLSQSEKDARERKRANKNKKQLEKHFDKVNGRYVFVSNRDERVWDQPDSYLEPILSRQELITKLIGKCLNETPTELTNDCIYEPDVKAFGIHFTNPALYLEERDEQQRDIMVCRLRGHKQTDVRYTICIDCSTLITFIMRSKWSNSLLPLAMHGGQDVTTDSALAE